MQNSFTFIGVLVYFLYDFNNLNWWNKQICQRTVRKLTRMDIRLEKWWSGQQPPSNRSLCTVIWNWCPTMVCALKSFLVLLFTWKIHFKILQRRKIAVPVLDVDAEGLLCWWTNTLLDLCVIISQDSLYFSLFDILHAREINVVITWVIYLKWSWRETKINIVWSTN